MLAKDETGAVSGLVVSFVLTVIALIGVLIFAVWSFSGRQDYKNNVDSKISAAVTVAKQQEGSAKDAAFAEAEKNPLKPYNGPDAYGSISLFYPKTWSGYVADSSNSNSSSGGAAAVDGYFYPGVVPSVTDQASVFALRLQVLNQPYAEVIRRLSQFSGDKAAPTVSPYALPKVPKVIGVKVDGKLPVSGGSEGVTGSMIIIPLRAQTIELWTEGNQFAGDFNNIILPNFSFSP